ncbi:MAG TPA: hypothetical protein VFY51_03710 [Pyrinomonadaceae bacterium]|nr:hypothetical protein [Pyrinomonadaceae bacterium]
MRGRSVFLILAFLLFTSAAQAQPAAAQAGTFEARVEEFLRQSGHEYHKVKANSWYILVNGKEMSQIRIILGAGPGSIAMGAVVVPKQKMKLSTEALQKLMKLSYDLNYVRVCIDSDDDLIVMAQLKDPWLNASEFRATINLVTSAADKAYAVMRPYLQ